MRPGEPVIDGMACAVNLAREVVREIPVGMGPEGIAVDAAGRQLSRIPVGSYPAGLGHHPELRRVYCGDTAAGTITVIDTDTLRAVGTGPAEPGAGSIAVDAERGRGPAGAGAW